MINTGSTIPRVGDGENKAHGRWRLNSGSEMIMNIPGLSKKPIRVVVDLSTAKFANQKISALAKHDEDNVIGYWDRGDISSQGIDADLHLVEPANEVEAGVFPDAVKVAGLARTGVPLQVSIGCEPTTPDGWQLIPPGEVLRCNAREYQGGTKDDLPLYCLRHGSIFESSILTFGADSVTGRIAARRTTPVKEETAMSDKLKKLLSKHAEKHHGLVARCVAEDMDEAAIETKIQAADMAEKDAEIVALKSENTALKTEVETLKQTPVTGTVENLETVEAGKTVSDKVAKAAAGSKTGVTFKPASETPSSAPKTLSEGMKAEIQAGSNLKGFALRNAVIAKYPNIERI